MPLLALSPALSAALVALAGGGDGEKAGSSGGASVVE